MSQPARILIYSACAGYYHEVTPQAIEILKEHGPSINAVFDATEDKEWFTDERLSSYDALLFLNNSEEVLDEAGKGAFQRYLDLGGNFIGVHCASACLRDTEFYVKEIGAIFDYHPDLGYACVDVSGPPHPSTSMLPAKWRLFDEMYNFRSDPRDVGATVILTADETSYEDTGVRKFNHGEPHPIAWYQERGAGVQPGGTAGRSWYTGLGHGPETWTDKLFLAHVLAGIQWAVQSGTTKFSNPAALVGNSITA